jgi:hypothetical protein
MSKLPIFNNFEYNGEATKKKEVLRQHCLRISPKKSNFDLGQGVVLGRKLTKKNYYMMEKVEGFLKKNSDFGPF